MEERTRGLPIGGKGKLHIHEIPRFLGPFRPGSTASGSGVRGAWFVRMRVWGFLLPIKGEGVSLSYISLWYYASQMDDPYFLLNS